MESLNYTLEGKGPLFSDGSNLPMDAFAWSKTIKRRDFSFPSDCDKNPLGPHIETVQSMGFTGSSFPDVMRKSLPSSPDMGFLYSQIADDSNKTVSSPPSLVTSNLIVGELEPGSRFSTSVIKSDDMKLEESSLLAKRARTTYLSSQSPICQVLGCNKDLSSSKDYYKRHRVCDIHSKTAKVIVNGNEQRFCQQCSRFHLLAEFDDGKRSCRKRLADHNERRRKPPLNTNPGQSHKLLQFYRGSRLGEVSFPMGTSFVFPDIPPDGFLCPQIYENNKQWKHIKSEEPIFGPNAKGQTPRSVPQLHGTVKQFPCSVFSSKTDYPLLSAASTVEELPGVSTSSCALSLLSAQSQNMPSHSTSILMGVPKSTQGTHHANHGIFPNSVKSLGTSTSGESTLNGFYSSGVNLVEVGQVQTPLIGDAVITFDSDGHAEALIQRAESVESEHCLSPESGFTIDLLQLSSNLQRVEQQRDSVQVKPEKELISCFSAIGGLNRSREAYRHL